MPHSEVVRVFSTTLDPDFDCPWQVRPPSDGTGSGVVIGPDQILTGAHVVANATFVQVQKPSLPDKAVARVRAVSHDCDLALLEVVEPGDFLADVTPATLGDLPRLRDEVVVVGYPVGGEEISITEGVVSRVEVQRYSHSQRDLLAITVDAAINAGNSGGPVFGDGHVVGIAFQKKSSADRIGEMVPAPVIRWFLDGVAGARSLQAPALGVTTQGLENVLLRTTLGLGPDGHGVAVIKLDHGGSSDGVLAVRDVITAIDGHAIANNGTVQYRGHHRTRLDVALVGRYVGDRIPLSTVRAGQRREVEVVLRPWLPLVPRTPHDQLPAYFVYAGLVFQTLTRDFLATWGDRWWEKAPAEFRVAYYWGERTAARHEVVVLTQVLADEINVGYSNLYNESVLAVDGMVPRDLTDFVARLTEATGIVEILMSSGGIILLETAAVRAATARILARYHIPADRSADLPR